MGLPIQNTTLFNSIESYNNAQKIETCSHHPIYTLLIHPVHHIPHLLSREPFKELQSQQQHKAMSTMIYVKYYESFSVVHNLTNHVLRQVHIPITMVSQQSR